MKKIENNFAVTGFVAKDAEVRQFTTTSVARFPLAVARQEKNGEETKRISAFMNIEAWRKNENTGSFDQLTKGTLLTVEGYFTRYRSGTSTLLYSFILHTKSPPPSIDFPVQS